MESERLPSSRFRSFEVVGKHAENSLITSFLLRPVDPGDWRPFVPGQFMVLPVPGPDGARVLRHYSVSSDPAAEGCYRITVKREEAPDPGLPDGVGSCFLHREIEAGARIEADGPLGAFRLDSESRRPLVLLSGGVGITPMMAMLHAASRDADRDILFIHACRDGGVHAFASEVAQIAARRPGIRVHTVYERPRAEDRLAARHHGEGFVNRATLQSLLPLDDYDFYLCGPSPFMQAIYRALRDLGVDKARIAYEFFGPASLLEPVSPEPPAESPKIIADPTESDDATVSFARTGIAAAWTKAEGTLLDLAESQGLRPDFSCRAGICGTCRVALLAGSVAYIEPPLDAPPDGEILLCCSKPVGPVTLDL